MTYMIIGLLPVGDYFSVNRPTGSTHDNSNIKDICVVQNRRSLIVAAMWTTTVHHPHVLMCSKGREEKPSGEEEGDGERKRGRMNYNVERIEH